MLNVPTAPKILFISSELPYPPHGGGTLKSFRLLEYLTKNHDLTLLCPLKNDNIRYLDELKIKINLKNFYTEPVVSKRSAFAFFKSILCRRTLNQHRTYSKKLTNIASKIAQDFDCIFVDHYEAMQFVPDNCPVPVVLHQHNAEYVLWSRAAKQYTNPFKKLALLFESLRIAHAERKECLRAQVILAAPNDILELCSLGLAKESFIETYHLGDQELLQMPTLSASNCEQALVTVGTLSWEPNVDGIIWFLQECWVVLKEKYPDLSFNIIGKNPPVKLKEEVLKHQGVTLTGFVEDLEQYFKFSKVFVAPLRFGSGMKVKVLNALYRGLPTVTTTIGAEGLELSSRQELLVADSAEKFTDKIENLLNDNCLWQEMHSFSRELAAKHYTWEKNFNLVQSALDKVL